MSLPKAETSANLILLDLHLISAGLLTFILLLVPAESTWLQRSSALPEGWRDSGQLHYWCVGWPLTWSGRTAVKHTELMTANCSICSVYQRGCGVVCLFVVVACSHFGMADTPICGDMGLRERQRDGATQSEAERCVNWLWPTVWTRDFRQGSPPACNEVSSGWSNHHQRLCQASECCHGNL